MNISFALINLTKLTYYVTSPFFYRHESPILLFLNKRLLSYFVYEATKVLKR
jgi:hypothetical protein